MKKVIRQFTITFALVAGISCKGFSGVFTDDKVTAFIPGSVINLPTASGGFQSATVIEMNGDGVADGLDLDGNGVPEILYVSLGAERAIGLDLDGDGVIDYYLIIDFDGAITLQTARSGGSKVKVTTDSNGATGFDAPGAGGSPQDIFTRVRNDSTAPTIGATPGGGTFTGPQSITLTCSDSVACNAVAFTTDGSDPSFAGQTSIIVPGKSTTKAITSTTTLKYITRDAKGNVSGIGQQTYTINSGSSTYSIGGTISGLSGTVVLQNNAGNNLSVSANGSFAFSTTVATGANYAVTVLTQPTGQTCTVSSGSGTVASANITSVSISCANNNYTIGGTISGLSGTVVLQNNSGNDLTLTTNGAFTFSTSIAHNATYSVTVLTQPAGQTCTVSSGSGTVHAANVTGVAVSCASVTCVYGTGTYGSCNFGN